MLRAVQFVLLALVTLSLSACRDSEADIVHYKKPRVDADFKVAGPPREKDRVVAVLVDEKGKTWTFFLKGPVTAVAAHADKYFEFLKSIKFGDNPPLSWKTPPGWKDLPGNEIRFATIKTDPEPTPLEVTVVPLPKEGGDVLSNVNRWRGQLSLPPAEEKDLPQMTKAIDIDGRAGTLVFLEGQFGKGKGPPMMPGPVAPKKADGGGVKYELPEGWAKVPPKNKMIVEQFGVGTGDKSAEAIIVVMNGDAGGDARNLARWREQIKLPELKNEAELLKEIVPLETAMGKARFVDLDNPGAPGNNRILGVIVPSPQHGVTFFLKLFGPSEIVGREKARFEAFAKSFKVE